MTESAQEWFKRFPTLGEEPVFRLSFHVGNFTRIIIRAYEGPVQHPHGHTTLFCELDVKRPDQKSYTRLFPRESFYVGIPSGQTIDGDSARELVMSLFAMKPGDTDEGFFQDYTQEQLDFVERFSDEFKLIAERRYGEV